MRNDRRARALAVVTVAALMLALAGNVTPADAVPGTSAQPSPVAPQVTVTELPPLPGTSDAPAPLDINNHGQVVGESSGAAVLWDDGQPIALPRVEGQARAYATHINDRGEVIIRVESPGRPPAAYRWFEGELANLASSPDQSVVVQDFNERGEALVIRDLPTIHEVGVWHDGSFVAIPPGPSGTTLIATDLSDEGHVVGEYIRPLGTPLLPGRVGAWVWHDGSVSRLGSLWSGGAQAVNRHGHVVGYGGRLTADGVLWRDGRSITLGFQPLDMNDRTQVAGLRGSSGGLDVVLWDDGRITRLATIANTSGIVLEVNERGQVAISDNSLPDDRAHLWTNGRLVELGLLDDQVGSTRLALNDEGQAVGQLDTPDGLKAVIWEVDADDPTDPPEPACVTATNAAHVEAGRATSWLVFAWAAGSGQYLGLTSQTTSLRESVAGRWEVVTGC